MEKISVAIYPHGNAVVGDKSGIHWWVIKIHRSQRSTHSLREYLLLAGVFASIGDINTLMDNKCVKKYSDTVHTVTATLHEECANSLTPDVFAKSNS